MVVNCLVGPNFFAIGCYMLLLRYCCYIYILLFIISLCSHYVILYCCSNLLLRVNWFLADRTNGRAYVHLFIVAKRYVLPKNCLKKQIGLPDCYAVVRYQFGPPTTSITPNGGTGSTRKNLLPIAAKPLQLASYGYYWQPIGTYQRSIQRHHRRPLTDTCSPKIGVPTAPPLQKKCVLPGSTVGYPATA